MPPTAVDGLEHRDVDVGTRSRERVGGGQPGDAAADDDDARHVWQSIVIASHAVDACTSSTTRVSTSGSVSGSTP